MKTFKEFMQESSLARIKSKSDKEWYCCNVCI